MIFSEGSALVLILDKTDSSIPSTINLFINGDKSYDPNNISSIEYLWTCANSNGQSCNNILLSQKLSNLTILSSSLTGRTDLLITLTISADTRTASKTVTFNIIDNLYTYIDVLFNTIKIEPSFNTYIQTAIISTGSYSIS